MSQRRPLLTNFSEYTLAASVDELATAIALGSVEGLPEITSPDEYIPMVLRDATVNREVVHVTAVDTGSNTVTVLRGQEGTTAQSWNAQAYIYVTLTSEAAADLQAYAQYQAEDARDKAEQWAEEITDVEVEPGKFSASHHRTKAQAAQTAAELARDAAEGFKNDAGDRADWAAGYAGDAQDWAIKTDGEVVPGEYSAKTHAQNAAATLEDAVKKTANGSDFTDPAAVVSNIGALPATTTPTDIGAADDTLSNLSDNNTALLNLLAGAELMVVRDVRTSGTSGGGFSSGAWRTRVLNDVVHNTITGALLSNNQVSLPTGTYLIYGRAPARKVDGNQTRLFNNTTTTQLLAGSSNVAAAGTATHSDSVLLGVVTLAAQGALSIDHYCLVSNTSDGFGAAGGIVEEVYTQLYIWRIA